MERVRREVDGSQLSIGDLEAFGILVFIELGTHLEAGIGCGRCDQLDNGAIAAQRLTSPVDGDEGEKAVLDLVPLAGAGRQMADRDGKLQLVGQLLKLDFPQAHTIAVAAATIG